ncbi:SGNH/GDSL hydrolase family protein [Maribacter sp. X9]|uniref:SGNH/GDSL hydrolase family protein n=1 Tax=Maribacter sp. X9 TaxID=3402159 RepID=UPI003AF372EF
MKRIQNSTAYYNVIFLALYLIGFQTFGQTENKFTNEVKVITQKNDSLWDPSKETIVFTGSSSVRFWKSLQEDFPNRQILNSGFGGSQASDLLIFLDELVLTYNPSKVFIYEGDNDLWAKKRPNQVIGTTEEIIERIKATNAATKIVLISAKPSISRWKMRGRFKRLNRKLKRLSENDPFVDYIDVWYPMLDSRKLRKDIFIEDGLHMNKKGYDIWYQAMKDLVNNP